MDNFHEVLDALTVSELKKCLPFLFSKQNPTRKADIIKLIIDDCSKHHRDYWNKLSKLEKKVLEEVIHQVTAGPVNTFNSSRFKAKYGEIPNYFIASTHHYGRRHHYGRSNPKKSENSYLTVFLYSNTRIFPDEFRQWMKTYVPKPAKTSIPTVEESELPKVITIDVNQYHIKRGRSGDFPVHLRLMENIATTDMGSLLRFVETGKFTVSDKTNRATAATLRKIDELLLGGDYYHVDEVWDISKYEGSSLLPIRSFAWPLLLQASGLARRVGKKLQLTAKGKKALTAPFHETAALLYQRWSNKRLLDEFSRIDTIKGQASKGRVMSAVVERRHSIEELLTECPINEWMSIDSLLQYAKATGTPLKICNDEWKLYIGDKVYGSLGYGGGFKVLEGRYILVYLFEYLATMGLLDIAYTLPYWTRMGDLRDMWGADDLLYLSRYDGLCYFRINPLGAYCLGMTDSYIPQIIEKPALITINDNLQLNLLREPDPAENLMLERYAERISAKQWQLTEAKILEAIENRFSAGDFQQFIQDSTVDPNLPMSIQSFFTIAAEREHALSNQGAAHLLQCYSEAFAKILASNTATKNFCMHVEGRVIVVTDKNKQKFSKGLRQLGYIYPQEKS